MDLIEQVQYDISEEQRQKQPKYARVSRKHLKGIEQLHKSGVKGLEPLLEDLLILPTQPWTSLDSNYKEVDGKYVETDSYTGAVIEDPPKRAKRVPKPYVALLNAIENPVKVITPETPNNIEEAYQNLGYSEGMVKQAVEASRERFHPITEDVWYEAGKIPSVPLTQDKEQELKITDEYKHLWVMMKPYIDRLKDELHFQIVHFQKVQNMYVDMLSDVTDLREEDAQKYARENAGINPMFDAFIFVADTHNFPLTGHGTYRLVNMSNKVPHDGVRSYAFSPSKGHMSVPKAWGNRVKEEMRKSQYLQDLLRYANQIHDQFAPQDMLLVLSSVINAFLLEDSDLDRVGAVGYASLGHFYEVWPDLLDELADNYIFPRETSEEKISEVADHFTEMIIENQFTLDGQTHAELMKKIGAKADPITGTRAYAAGAFSFKKNPNEAGYENWRMTQSPYGALRYRQVFAETKELRKAWRAFWITGHIVKLHQNGADVWYPGGKTERLNWNLLAWKNKSRELEFLEDERPRIKKALTDRKIGEKFLETL